MSGTPPSAETCQQYRLFRGADQSNMNPITGLICMLGALPGFVSQTIHVWQTPVIWATEGSSVTLPCDYRIIGEDASIGSYKWYRHIVRSKVEVFENNINFSGRFSRVANDQFFHRRSAAITLHPVELSDSGMYYCEVIFQIGQQIIGDGNGTFLNVTGFQSQTIHVWQTPVIWATEGSSVTLPCDYRIIGVSASIGNYKWYKQIVKSRVEVSEYNWTFSGRLSRVVYDQFFHGRSAAITLQRVELSDCGMYYCEVTFENGQKISGDGTFLNVTASISGPPPYTVPNIIRMALGVLVVLAALYVCCSSGDKKNGNHDLESKQSEVKHNLIFSQPNAPPSEEKMV